LEEGNKSEEKDESDGSVSSEGSYKFDSNNLGSIVNEETSKESDINKCNLV
jgi:hypothetical protein